MHTKTHQMMGITFLNCTFIKNLGVCRPRITDEDMALAIA